MVYGKTYIHDVTVDDAKFDLHDYDIKIEYPAKLKCSESELLAEFNSIWPTINKSWMQFKSSLPKPTVLKRFWIHIISEHAVVYPNLCDLLVLLLSISPGTGPVERSYANYWR